MTKPNKTHLRPSKSTLARALTKRIVRNMQSKNRVLAKAGDVPRYGLDTYANPAKGIYGVQPLIASILKARRAVFSIGVENHPSDRRKAIKRSLYAEEIIQRVGEDAGKECFARYTIYHYLCTLMPKQNVVGKIRLSKDEDRPRPCSKPRIKFYLIKH